MESKKSSETLEPNRSLFVVYKSEPEKVNIILDNTITMLSNRIYIDENGNKQPLLNKSNAEKSIDDRGDNVFVIKTNKKEKYAIKITFQKITTLGKQSPINDFFKDFVEYKKIIIAKDFNAKIMEYLNQQDTQIFKESIMLFDLLSHVYQPQFIILSPKEIEKFKSEYNVTNYTIKKMYKSDPVAKYLDLKKNDVVKIIRPSPTSGEAIDYRVVI
jgi:DNA-directed RNA polymerase subunit H (RpoH/RPB5)